MKAKHLLGLLMTLAVACTSEHPRSTSPVVGGTGGRMPGGGTNGNSGEATPTGSTGVSAPAGGTGGVAGGLTGGAAGTAGAGSTADTGNVCATADACGGDVVGDWTILSSCLRTSGRSDISMFGLPCTTAEITGTVSVTGSLVLTDDRRYTDKTVTTGSETWALDPKCLDYWAIPVTCEEIGAIIRSVLSESYEDFTCTDATSGGCTCQGKINQSGGMGVLYNDIHATGKYTLTGGTLALDDVLKYSVCAANRDRLTVSPQPALGTKSTTGSIVLGKTTD